jgi:hypothetical protein
VVFHDKTWWSNGLGRSLTNGGSVNHGHGDGWGSDLIRTAEYVSLLEIVDVRVGSWLERPTLELEAKIRYPSNSHGEQGVHGLVIGDPDDLRLSVDAERGVILRSRSWFGGMLYRTLEMTEVAFDEALGAETFAIQPLPGQTWT